MSKSKEMLKLFNDTENVVVPVVVTPVVEAKPVVNDGADDELNAILDDKYPQFDMIYDRIIAYIDRRPVQLRAHMYKMLMTHLLSKVVGISMVNRKLLLSSKDFLRRLLSGEFSKQ